MENYLCTTKFILHSRLRPIEHVIGTESSCDFRMKGHHPESLSVLSVWGCVVGSMFLREAPYPLEPRSWLSYDLKTMGSRLTNFTCTEIIL